MNQDLPLETRFIAHTAEVRGEFKAVNAEIRSLTKQINRLVEGWEKSRRIPWGAGVGFLGVLLTIGGSFFGYIHMTEQRLNSDIQRIEKRVDAVTETVLRSGNGETIHQEVRPPHARP